MQKLLLYISVVLLVLSSCVTPKIHNALITEAENTKNALKQSEKRVIALTGELEEKSGKIIDLKQQIAALRNDSLQNGKSLVALQSKYDEKVIEFQAWKGKALAMPNNSAIILYESDIIDKMTAE